MSFVTPLPPTFFGNPVALTQTPDGQHFEETILGADGKPAAQIDIDANGTTTDSGLFGQPSVTLTDLKTNQKYDLNKNDFKYDSDKNLSTYSIGGKTDIQNFDPRTGQFKFGNTVVTPGYGLPGRIDVADTKTGSNFAAGYTGDASQIGIRAEAKDDKDPLGATTYTNYTQPVEAAKATPYIPPTIADYQTSLTQEGHGQHFTATFKDAQGNPATVDVVADGGAGKSTLTYQGKTYPLTDEHGSFYPAKDDPIRKLPGFKEDDMAQPSLTIGDIKISADSLLNNQFYLTNEKTKTTLAAGIPINPNVVNIREFQDGGKTLYYTPTESEGIHPKKDMKKDGPIVYTPPPPEPKWSLWHPSTWF